MKLFYPDGSALMQDDGDSPIHFQIETNNEFQMQ